MDRFSRARVGSVAPLEPRIPQKLLLALDGSTQDAFGITLATQLRERFGCSLTVVDARDSVDENELASRVAESIGAAAIPKTGGESFQQIIAAVENSECDLLLCPCPYGRDLEAVGPDSAGTVIDVLLARSPVPILVVRHPYEPHAELFLEAVLILTAENEVAASAAAWAAGLVSPRGTLHLLLIMEKEMHENVRALMQSLAPDMDVSTDSLAQALAHNYMRLHSSLQKCAGEAGFEYKLHLQVEDEPGLVAREDANEPTLRVLALERKDHVSEGTVQARIRQSRHPVLVVCGLRHEKSPQAHQ
jgi:hypothetical protein